MSNEWVRETLTWHLSGEFFGKNERREFEFARRCGDNDDPDLTVPDDVQHYQVLPENILPENAITCAECAAIALGRTLA